MSITTNLLRYWNAATAETRNSGLTWYRDARQTILRLAHQHDKSPAVVAGVVAATSPRINWCRNVRVTDELLAGRTVIGVFRANLDKARRIIAGAKPLRVLGGNKVRSFYRALLGDGGAVVVDVWMQRAAGITSKLTTKRYTRIAVALAALAEQLNITAADLQATIWVAVRGGAK